MLALSGKQSICVMKDSINIVDEKAYLKRPNLTNSIAKAVVACITHGGALALVGASGFGKSVLAKQFVSECSGAVYFDGENHHSNKTKAPELHGIAVVDEAWQFEGITNEIDDFVRLKHGVVVIIATSETEARAVAGENLKVIFHVPHWRSFNGFSQTNQHQLNTEVPAHAQQKPIRSGVIRFRSPSGEVWTGVGRKPNWIKSLEAGGRSCEEFRVNDTPLPRKKISNAS